MPLDSRIVFDRTSHHKAIHLSIYLSIYRYYINPTISTPRKQQWQAVAATAEACAVQLDASNHMTRWYAHATDGG